MLNSRISIEEPPKLSDPPSRMAPCAIVPPFIINLSAPPPSKTEFLNSAPALTVTEIRPSSLRTEYPF